MKKYESTEIYSSAVCNLNCIYCYIPKVKSLKISEREIIEQIENGEYIKKIKSVCPDLENLSLWGAEPTITLPIVGDHLPDFFDVFKNLKTIMFSTNLIKEPDVILDFIKKIPEDREVELKIQFSIDGHEEITDKNRGKGTTNKISKNIRNLAFMLNDVTRENLHITLHTKVTWTMENIKYFYEDLERLNHSYDFFKKLDDDLSRINTNKNVKYEIVYWGNVELPGKYTLEDSKIFTKLCKECFYTDRNWTQMPLSSFIFSLKKAICLSSYLYTKHAMFTCSAGDSQVGIGVDGYHLCHRTYTFYLDEIKKFEECNVDFCYGKIIIRNENMSKDIHRFSYVNSGYHNFLKLEINSAIMLIYELAKIGEILPKYLEYKNAYLLALMFTCCFTCPVEYFLEHKTYYIPNIPLLRLLGNGALDIFLDYMKKTIERNEDKIKVWTLEIPKVRY